MGDKLAFLQPDSDERRLASRIEDMARVADNRKCVRFTAFLTEREQTIVRASLAGRTDFRLFGGYAGAERCMLGVGSLDAPPPEEEFPLRAAAFRFRADSGILHRDVLGTLMALSIRREAVGDILVGDSVAVAFVSEPLILPIIQEVTRIGGVGVSTSTDLPEVLPDAHRVEESGGVVASMRFDCIVAMLTRESRADVQDLIRQGLVRHNDREANRPSRTVEPGDVISIRGVGKFKIGALGTETKKGRLHVAFTKYK
ncbi:MAG: YlmH/Sll1252 family protein [Oscillospiraceae bacterium]